MDTPLAYTGLWLLCVLMATVVVVVVFVLPVVPK